MTSWLGSLWGSSLSYLPYDLSPTPTLTTRSGWAIHTATPKQHTSASAECTAFRAQKYELSKVPLRSGTGQTQLIPALHHFQRIKRLVHPRILRAHATLDTDYPNDSNDGSASSAPGLDALHKTLTTGTLIVVTERVDALDYWLDNHLSLGRGGTLNAEQVSWGIYNIVEALVFLHNQAKLAHGMVCPDAIFVTPGGDFKLGGFDLVTPLGEESGGPTPHFQTFDAAGVCPDDYRSPERIAQRYDAMHSNPVHSMDCYSLAILIEYIYSHPNAGTAGKVPAPLQKALVRMKNDSPKLRPRLQPLLKCPIFDNPYVKTQLFLDEAMAKPVEERIAFLQNLSELLNRGVLDERAAVYKLLPLLIMILKANAGNETAMSQDVNRRQVLAVVPLLFQVAEAFLTKDSASGEQKQSSAFQTHIAPLIPCLFGINDRGVRGAILQKISLLENHLDKNTINAQVFDPMCSGFTDSSGPLRELTLKSTIVLVPKLNAASLEKMVRYLVRLQSDPEASIRTNTIIFVGKVSPSLSDMSRQKLILPAFTRAMKDPFTPCRLAALKAVIACKSYFTQKDVAEKVLPCIVPHLLDGAKEVRTEAFKVVDMFLVGLREESGRMGQGGELKEGTASNITGAAPTSGGYLSGLSSWMSTSAEPASTDAPVANAKPVVPSANGGVTHSNAPKFSSLSLSDAQIGGASKLHTNDRGWDDEGADGDGWDDDDFGTRPGKSNINKSNEDDFFATFDSKPTKAVAKTVGVGMSASRPAPQLHQSSGLKVKKQLPKPAVKKLPTSNDPLDDGWDDF
ncbi:hypothetical protein ACHAW6_015802 [Cyclotella cf. meneghiniana]